MESDKQYIDLSELFLHFRKTLRRMWIFVLIFAAAFGALAYVRAYRAYAPMYVARARFTVNSGVASDDIRSSGSSWYDNKAAEELAAAFPNILSTDIMRDLMTEYLGTSYIDGTVSAKSSADTNLFTLTVRSSSPKSAYDVLNAAIACYPKVAVYMVDNPSLIIREAPTLPTEPYNEFNAKTTVIKGALAGAAAALILVFLVSLMSRTVTTTGELRDVVNLPILAVLPFVNLKKRSGGRTPYITPDSDSGYTESVRGLRVKLKKKLVPDKKIVMITSTLAGEGKTTVVVNLALSAVGEGKKVVIVDADLRNQSVGEFFADSDEKPGLMEYLENPEIGITDCLRDVSGSALKFISSASTDKRHYHIDRKAFASALKELTLSFDYIIIDAPPCGVVADAGILCGFADAVVYVVKQDYVKKSQITEAVSTLYGKNADIVGCVFNGVRRRHSRYGTDMGTDTGMATENTDTALRNTVTGKAVILRAETTRIRTKNDR